MPRQETHPTLQKLFESKMRTAVKAYNRQYDLWQEELKDCEEAGGDDPDMKIREKERLLRGMVRGSAQMLLCLYRPYEHKNTDAINDLEADFGVKGVEYKKTPPVVSHAADAYYR